MDLQNLIPADIEPLVAWGLILASFFTSLITASMGAGGGVLLLMLMSLVLPPAAIIPVHGMIQLGSNVGRSAMARHYIHWPTLHWFIPGVVLGTAAGALVLVQLPPVVWQLCIAIFVLYLCWGPELPGRALGRGGLFLVAAATTFASLFVGATGPLVAAYLKQVHRDRSALVATFAMVMVFQHGPKGIVFGLSGFVFGEWLAFIALMIACGAMGTWVGLNILGRLSDNRFQRTFNILLSLLALRLLWQAGRDLATIL